MILPSVHTPSTSETMMRISAARTGMRRMLPSSGKCRTGFGPSSRAEARPTFLRQNRGDQCVAIFGGAEEMIGPLGDQFLRRSLSRGDGDGGRAVRSAAADVVDRVADDDHVTSAKTMAARRGRALNGNGRKLLTPGRIAA